MAFGCICFRICFAFLALTLRFCSLCSTLTCRCRTWSRRAPLAEHLAALLFLVCASVPVFPQVIVALQERSMGLRRGHVPYRNSTLTSVLRDRHAFPKESFHRFRRSLTRSPALQPGWQLPHGHDRHRAAQRGADRGVDRDLPLRAARCNDLQPHRRQRRGAETRCIWCFVHLLTWRGSAGGHCRGDQAAEGRSERPARGGAFPCPKALF